MRLLILAIALCLFFACNGSTTTDELDSTRIFITGKDSIAVGQTTLFESNTSGGNTEKVRWFSSNESIATVDSNGYVKGVHIGEVTITGVSIDDDTRKATRTVYVVSPIISLKIVGDTTVYVDQTIQLAVNISVLGNAAKTISWHSRDTQTATIGTQSGLLKGLQDGQVTIIATSTVDTTQQDSLIIHVVDTNLVDVYLIGGQSNADGLARLLRLESRYTEATDVQIYFGGLLGIPQNHNKWHYLHEVPAGWSGSGGNNFGIERMIGYQLQEKYPQKKIRIIKYSVGGSSLAVNWNPGDAVGTGRGAQYTNFLSTVRTGLQELVGRGEKPIIRGMFWQQGEADAANQTHASNYLSNLKTFIGNIRGTFSEYSQHQDFTKLAFVLGQVLPYFNTRYGGLQTPYRETIRKAQLDIIQELTNIHTVLVDTSFRTHYDEKDGYLDTDSIHFNWEGITKLGVEMSEKMIGAYD
jgi:hypothetical protein